MGGRVLLFLFFFAAVKLLCKIVFDAHFRDGVQLTL
jgi:hypothetical protein